LGKVEGEEGEEELTALRQQAKEDQRRLAKIQGEKAWRAPRSKFANQTLVPGS